MATKLPAPRAAVGNGRCQPEALVDSYWNGCQPMACAVGVARLTWAREEGMTWKGKRRLTDRGVADLQ